MTGFVEIARTTPDFPHTRLSIDPVDTAQHFHDEIAAARVGRVIAGRSDPASSPAVEDRPDDAAGPLPLPAGIVLGFFFVAVFVVNAVGWNWVSIF